MPKRSNRGKKRKFRRVPSGKSRMFFAENKAGKHSCGICKRALHGMPHGKKRGKLRKLSKSERKPTALFSGTLCNKCRSIVIEEAIKVKVGAKKEEETEVKFRNYIKKAMVKIK